MMDWSEFAICQRCKEYNHKNKHCNRHPYTSNETPQDPKGHCNMFETADEKQQKSAEKYFEKEEKKSRKKEELKNKDEEQEPSYTSFFIDDTMMVQQIYDEKTNIPKFVVCNNSHIETVSSFKDATGIEYQPIMGEELQLKVVLLPTGIEEYGTTPQLVVELKKYIHKYLDVSPRFEQFAAWYILLTWVYDRFSTINYLRCLGDTGCGKTRFLNVIGGICFNATKASGAVTVAVMKRITKKWKGTIIVDEGDFKESDEKNELIKFFNLGFEKDSPMMNCDKEDPNKLEFYIPFCPKIISTRKSFDDKALEARCLTEVMQQTSRDDVPYILPDQFYKEQAILRNKLLKFRFDNYRKINTEKSIDLSNYQIEPRLKQATYAYATLFAGDELEIAHFKSFLEEYQKDLIQERQESWDGQVIGAIHKLYEKGAVDFDTTDIIESGNLTDYKGNPLKARSLTKILKSLGLHKILIKKVGGSTKRTLNFELPILIKLFKRYGYAVTQVTNVTDTCDKNNNANCLKVLSDYDSGYDKVKVDTICVTSVTSVTEETIEDIPETINIPCKRCGAEPPSKFWSRTGQPICEDCHKTEFGEKHEH
jgi:energy-coupling factor transporter ATP-binding protein EcfA2